MNNDEHTGIVGFPFGEFCDDIFEAPIGLPLRRNEHVVGYCWGHSEKRLHCAGDMFHKGSMKCSMNALATQKMQEPHVNVSGEWKTAVRMEHCIYEWASGKSFWLEGIIPPLFIPPVRIDPTLWNLASANSYPIPFSDQPTLFSEPAVSRDLFVLGKQHFLQGTLVVPTGKLPHLQAEAALKTTGVDQKVFYMG